MKYVTRKFDGDDEYSWAVFLKEELPKGHRGIVFWGDARPILTGCSRRQANHHRDQVNAQYKDRLKNQ
jgi:hypothetical protein